MAQGTSTDDATTTPGTDHERERVVIPARDESATPSPHQCLCGQLGAFDPTDDAYWNDIDEATADLRHDPQLLDRLEIVIELRGYAGSPRPAVVVYLAITSRLLERPMNVNIVGESASGKNATVEAAIELQPPGAVHVVSAASPMAMMYEKENFQHRHIFFMEADSIPEDGRAGSAIRSLAADNIVRYSTVERNPETNELETRTIVKNGPTGLLTTTTKNLDPQLTTRMLEHPLLDDPAQTRAVMEAHADRVNPSRTNVDDIEEERTRFILLQEYLIARGEWRVAVPYAGALARLIPNTAVRMRRDFRQLLTCIQAIALLYQWQRPRNSEGWVEASLDDYARARDLLAPIFDTVAADGLTDVIRETVTAVGPSERNVSEAALRGRLGRSKTAVCHRVQRAISGGWLINDEKERGFPARLRRGAPLPTATTTALPPVHKLRDQLDAESKRF
jgi:hypothetical protein